MDISEINKFFKEYAQAYLEFNADSLVRFFNLPTLIHDQAGIHLLNSAEEVKLYAGNFLESLKQRKITRIESELLECDFSPQLSNAVDCKLSSKLFDTHTQLIIDFDYKYSLVKGETWKILFARLGKVRKY